MYRRVLLVLVVLLFSGILIYLLERHVALRREIEGFTISDSNVVAIQTENKIVSKLRSIPPTYGSKMIGNMCIKAAYAGAYDGVDTTLDMMYYTLQLGYRYVVLHVFNAPIDSISLTPTAVVGYSSTYPLQTNTASKVITLVDLLPFIQQNAFLPTTCTNADDPFFIHILPAYQTADSSDRLGLETVKGKNSQLNTFIEQAVSILQGSNRLAGQVEVKSSLSELKGQLVISMDANPSQGNITQKMKDMIAFPIPTGQLQTAYNARIPPPNVWNVVLPIDENGTVMTSNSPYTEPTARPIYKVLQMNASPVCAWSARMVSSYLTMGAKATTNLGDYEQLFINEGGYSMVSFV